MKYYNRALEKRKYLDSMLKHTILVSSEEDDSKFESNRVERTTFESYRKENGERRNQSGRSCSTDRCYSHKCESHHETQSEYYHRFPCGYCEQHWTRSRIEDKESEVIAISFSRTLGRSS